MGVEPPAGWVFFVLVWQRRRGLLGTRSLCWRWPPVAGGTLAACSVHCVSRCCPCSSAANGWWAGSCLPPPAGGPCPLLPSVAVYSVWVGVVRHVAVSRRAVGHHIPRWGLAPARPAGPPTEGHGAAARRTASGPCEPAAPRHVTRGAPTCVREERGLLARRVGVKRCAPRVVGARDGVPAVRAPVGPSRRRWPEARGRERYILSCCPDGAATPSGQPASMARQGGGERVVCVQMASCGTVFGASKRHVRAV